MQPLTIQSDHITLPVEIFERLKGKKVEFVEYHNGFLIKPVSDFTEMSKCNDPDVFHTYKTEDELFQEIAILLYQKEKLTLGQASRLAQMSQIQFQHLIADRKIQIHYDVADFESDLKTLQDMGRI